MKDILTPSCDYQNVREIYVKSRRKKTQNTTHTWVQSNWRLVSLTSNKLELKVANRNNKRESSAEYLLV